MSKKGSLPEGSSKRNSETYLHRCNRRKEGSTKSPPTGEWKRGTKQLLNKQRNGSASLHIYIIKFLRLHPEKTCTGKLPHFGQQMKEQKNPSRFTPRGKGQEGGAFSPIPFLAHPLRANSSYKAILCFDPSPGPRHASHRIQWFLNLPPTGETMSSMHISPSPSWRPGPFPNLS